MRTRTIDLDHDQLLIIENQPGARADVYFGGLWLTEERCARDRFVTSRARAQLRLPGRAVLQAIGRTRTHVIEPACRQGWHWARSLWHLVSPA